MAWTSIIPLYGKKTKSDTVSYLKARIEYMTNEEKTNNHKYISCYKCQPSTAHITFEKSKQNYLTKSCKADETDIVAFRVIQSFKGYETTPEIANKIGYKLAKKLTNDNHAFIVTTHIDTDNIHNHITWCATTLDCNKKYDNRIGSWKYVARVSDEICSSYGLSVIVPSKENKTKDYGTWLDEKGKPKPKAKTFSAKIRLSIDEILKNNPTSFDDLLKQLESSGYEIKKSKDGKNVGLKGKGQKNFTYLNSLGENYSTSKLIDLILNFIPTQKPKDEKIQILKDIEKALNEKGVAYTMWAKRFNMNQLLNTVSFMCNNKLKTYADVKAMYENLNPRYEVINQKIKSIDEQMENVSKLQKVIIEYSKTKGTYNKYKLSGYSKKFKKENLKEITTFENAKAEYKKLGKGGKLPTMQELKQEYAKLKSAKQNAYNEYKQINYDMQDLINAKGNLEVLLEIEVEEKQLHQQEQEKQKSKDKDRGR